MIRSIFDSSTLHNGTDIPRLGLGVWQIENGSIIENAVKSALDSGYRSIDTAAVYGNETGVGKVIKNCGVAREELFITTKLWNNRQGYDSTLAAFEESRQNLGLEYIDLYLIHWPVKGKYKESWKALEKIYRDGKVRAIGVSNFQIYHLEDLMGGCEIKPMINQVEYHPLLIQKALSEFCRAQQILMEAWSPLMQGNLNHQTLEGIATKYGKTSAQVVLRWDLQTEVITIPKSVNPQRIKENADIFDFELTAEDVTKIEEMNRNHRYGADPDYFDF